MQRGHTKTAVVAIGAWGLLVLPGACGTTNDCEVNANCLEYGTGTGGATTSGSPTGTGGATTSGHTGTGGATGMCKPGDVKSCYSGPSGTENVGVCKAGTATCLEFGVFGQCTGDITPGAVEDCSTTGDDNCNGAVNEMCPCMPGEMAPCYDGPPATENVGPCKGGMQTCNPDGMGFGPCMGEVSPLPEDCATSIDEDCNGKTFDDMAADCVCDPAGAPLMCNVAGQKGACASGEDACSADGKGYDGCKQTVSPSVEDCFTDNVDEDCDGKVSGCTGTTLAGDDSGGNQDEQSFAVAADSMGNLAIGGITLGANGGFNPGNGTGYLARANSSGISLNGWPQAFTSGKNYVIVRGVAMDAAGQVVAVGEYQGGASFGGQQLQGNGDLNIFVAKYSATGAHMWSKGFGDGKDQRAYAVSLDANGNIYVTGEMAGSASFGGATLTTQGLSADVFVVKLDPNGGHIWSKNFGDSQNQSGWGIAVSGDSVVVAGEMQGTASFGVGTLSSAGNRDAFVACLKGADGSQIWAKNYGDSNDQIAYGVAVDPNGNVGLTGTFKGSITFGNNAQLGSTGGTNVFVARLASDGTPTWSLGFGDGKDQVGQAVALDGAGNVVVAGYFKGTLTFDGNTLTNADALNNNFDVFVAKLQGSTGKVGWARRFGDNQDQRAWAVTTDLGGNVIVVGTFQGFMNVGAPAGTLNSLGGYDRFFLKLAP